MIVTRRHASTVSLFYILSGSESCHGCIIQQWRPKQIFELACKYVYFCSKIGHFNSEVNGDWPALEPAPRGHPKSCNFSYLRIHNSYKNLMLPVAGDACLYLVWTDALRAVIGSLRVDVNTRSKQNLRDCEVEFRALLLRLFTGQLCKVYISSLRFFSWCISFFPEPKNMNVNLILWVCMLVCLVGPHDICLVLFPDTSKLGNNK